MVSAGEAAFLGVCAALASLFLFFAPPHEVVDTRQLDPATFDPRLPPSPSEHDLMRPAGFELYSQVATPSVSVEQDPAECRMVCPIVENPPVIDPTWPPCNTLDRPSRCHNQSWDSTCFHRRCDQRLGEPDQCQCIAARRCETYCQRNSVLKVSNWELVSLSNNQTRIVVDASTRSTTLCSEKHPGLRQVSYESNGGGWFSLSVPVYTGECHGVDHWFGRVVERLNKKKESLVWVKHNTTENRLYLAWNQFQGCIFRAPFGLIAADTRRRSVMTDLIVDLPTHRLSLNQSLAQLNHP